MTIQYRIKTKPIPIGKRFVIAHWALFGARIWREWKWI